MTMMKKKCCCGCVECPVWSTLPSTLTVNISGSPNGDTDGSFTATKQTSPDEYTFTITGYTCFENGTLSCSDSCPASGAVWGVNLEVVQCLPLTPTCDSVALKSGSNPIGAYSDIVVDNADWWSLPCSNPGDTALDIAVSVTA